MSGIQSLPRSARRLQKQHASLATLFTARKPLIESQVRYSAVHQNSVLVSNTLLPMVSVALRAYGTSTAQQSLSASLQTEEPSVDPTQAYFPNRRETSGLTAVFEPRSVAIIGATDRAGAVGRTIVKNLISGNEAGGKKYRIYPINPKKKTIMDLPTYPTIGDVPDDVDMAVIVTPAKTCVDIMKQCAEKGVKAAVVISAGFKEAGQEGIALENELIRVARSSGIRVIGPNCVGVMNPNFGLNATFAATMGLQGNVAFISQSGAMCTAVLDWSLREKIGFSAFVSVGSMADVNWGDLIDYLGDDPNTHSILIYMETAGHAASFLSAAKEVGLTKPIVVIKAGKSEQAAQAAASHTGSLAGSYKSFEAAMNRVGVMTVDSIQELFNCALVLGKQPRPLGPNLMIMTNAGGPAVLATDAAVNSGAVIPDITPTTLAKLDAFLPPSWSRHNPVDILGDAPAELYAKSLPIVLEDSNADGVLVILSPQDVTDPTDTAKHLIDAVETIKSKNPGRHQKPILAAWMGGDTVSKGFRMLNEAGIPTFSNPDEAAETFGRIWKQSAALDALYGKPEYTAPDVITCITPESRAKCLSILEKAGKEGRNLLTEAESKQVLSSYGIPIVKTVVANSPEEADAAAAEIGSSLYAVKLNSTTLTHKADVGGVKLNLKPEEVRKAFTEIQDSVAALHGPQHFQGVTVQPMVRLDKGLELILGSTVDCQFGPLVMFGSGGTMVEIFKDTAIGVPPFNDNMAQNLMKQTKIYKALKGAQGKRFEGVDIAKLQGILSKFSTMVVDLAEHVAECDINPLLATKDQFVALDARIALNKGGSSAPQLAVRPYPLRLVTSTILNNGQNITIRPIHSNDETRWKDFQSRLTPETVRLRYLADLPLSKRIAKDTMIRICHGDYDRLLTLVALNDTQEIVGMLQIERSPPSHLDRHRAFTSMVIRDDFQGKGLGTFFMQQMLEVARQEGITEFRAPVLAENTGFIKLAQRSGWTCEDNVDDSGVKLCSLKI